MESSLEIACDESGSEGEKLVGGNTKVFAHASVRLDIESAAACIQEVRHRAPSPTLEYKSDVIRRSKHREALKWMLGPSGPLLGDTHVYLIDKAFFVVTRVVDLIAAMKGADGDMAVDLYRDGPDTLGQERWGIFLESFNDLLRTKNGRGPGASVDEAFRMVDGLRVTGGRIGDIMELLSRARPGVELFRAGLLDDPRMMPVLDPLIPAIVQAVVHWGEGGRPVSIVHDRQTLLTEDRVARLHASRGGGLAGLRLVDSRSDPRIQVADLLAGAARKIGEDELNDRGDAELTALLRPYVDASSIWGEARSRSLLGTG
ncbi:DUF3800 domain-containing protein [Nonomuraea sp. NPDC049152]|uniref:DUF3800 domain-containing protein n=1 Tax=Nonomuraea sp. NPDC049152 TaxID=3154350 RepID=UPI0033FBA06C